MVKDVSKRTLLKYMALSPLVLSYSEFGHARVPTSAKIVIVGAGMAGLAIANRLSKRLAGAEIILIDKREAHYYQPGFTLVGTGIWQKHKVIEKTRDFIPEGVKWIQESVVEFVPENNQLVTDSGKKIGYDFLVIASGVVLGYDQIEGMDVQAIGQNGMTSIYAGPDAAAATWQSLNTFRTQGGRGIMTLPETFLKCAGAPLKMTFMVDDRLRTAHRREDSQLEFYSALKNVFSVPAVNQNVLERWKCLQVPVHFEQKLTAIDISARKATFTQPDGSSSIQEYDFIHVVPPMRTDDSIRLSSLASQEAPYAREGWLAVNRDTLQHQVYPNIFGLGDVNGTPKGKTAATVKKSVPLVTENLISVIQGKSPTEIFDGYTSCPLLIREGSALLVEFDYENRFIPSIPGTQPLTDSYLGWIMKTQFLKPAYLAVLRGRV